MLQFPATLQQTNTEIARIVAWLFSKLQKGLRPARGFYHRPLGGQQLAPPVRVKIGGLKTDAAQNRCCLTPVLRPCDLSYSNALGRFNLCTGGDVFLGDKDGLISEPKAHAHTHKWYTPNIARFQERVLEPSAGIMIEQAELRHDAFGAQRAFC